MIKGVAQPPDPKTGSIDYDLLWPIEFGSETITKVTVRRPKGKDARKAGAGGGSPSDNLDLIGRLICQPNAVVDLMDGADINSISEIIVGFSESGRPIGDAPTP